MPKLRLLPSAGNRIRFLFLVVGVPLGSMCITFLALYILVPVHRVTPPSIDNVVSKRQETNETPAAAPKPIAGAPVRIQITAIGVDTSINPVGLTSSGAMDIGENPDQVAWYQSGVIPGQIGSAVIAGHYGWKDGHGSIFNDLNKLKVGDTISVYDATGIETDFTVRESRLYDPSSDASDVFNDTDGKSHLNLITCQGTWINSEDTYSNRLVVFTDLK